MRESENPPCWVCIKNPARLCNRKKERKKDIYVFLRITTPRPLFGSNHPRCSRSHPALPSAALCRCRRAPQPRPGVRWMCSMVHMQRSVVLMYVFYRIKGTGVLRAKLTLLVQCSPFPISFLPQKGASCQLVTSASPSLPVFFFFLFVSMWQ